MTATANTYTFHFPTFLDRFRDEYEFLYEARDRVAGYDEAVQEFDKTIAASENFAKFVREFAAYREDPITSDREAAAFMFTFYALLDKEEAA